MPIFRRCRRKKDAVRWTCKGTNRTWRRGMSLRHRCGVGNFGRQWLRFGGHRSDDYCQVKVVKGNTNTTVQNNTKQRTKRIGCLHSDNSSSIRSIAPHIQYWIVPEPGKIPVLSSRPKTWQVTKRNADHQETVRHTDLTYSFSQRTTSRKYAMNHHMVHFVRLQMHYAYAYSK